MTRLAERVAEILGAGGFFEAAIPGFSVREDQVVLARAMADALEAGEHLVAEAGTGVGKTFAYLAPILAGDRRALISTATRTLQDQLFGHDLPLAARALGRPLRVAVLKGRRNYLCLERYRRMRDDLAGFAPAEPGAGTLAAWVRATATGDIGELPALGEGGELARALTVGADACLGVACPEFARCHVFAARRRAEEADVVIVNHSLLVADCALKAHGGEGILADVEAVVVDEAHALPEIARQGLAVSVGTAQLNELAQDAAVAARVAAGALAGATARMPIDLAPGRYGWEEARAALLPAVAAAAAAVDRLDVELDGVADTATLRARTASLRERLGEFLDRDGDAPDRFRWAEIRSAGAFGLHAGPLEPGAHFGAYVAASGASWTFTSATLGMAGRFDGFVREIGLQSARSLAVSGPFDYPGQARLFLPTGLPDVDDPDYTQAVIAAAEPLVRAARGGCFFLFTSRLAVRRAADGIRARGWSNPLFVQGEQPRARLLEDFRAAGNGVLCGTASFWEGVDVKGPALVLVVIDRLPFAAPSDPVLAARLRRCREHGGNPFAEIQLPAAVMALKQGAGRLIRDCADYGVLMVCDPRLRSRGYGRTFLASLPPMTLVSDSAEAERFLAGHAQRTAACA